MSDNPSVARVPHSKYPSKEIPNRSDSTERQLKWEEAERFEYGHVCGRITRAKIKDKSIYSIQLGKLKRNEKEEFEPFYSKTFFRPNDLALLTDLIRDMRYWIDADKDQKDLPGPRA